MVCIYMCVYVCVCIYINKKEYYSTIKKNEILSFAAMRMDLKSIILSEISQRKTNTVCYHLYMNLKNNINKCI